MDDPFPKAASVNSGSKELVFVQKNVGPQKLRPPGQMLPGQMSKLQSVLYVPRNLPLKFHQNQVINSWDIANIEFVWGGGLGRLG